MATIKQAFNERAQELALQISTLYSTYKQNVHTGPVPRTEQTYADAKRMVKDVCYKSTWVTDEELQKATPQLANFLLKNAFRIYLSYEMQDGMSIYITGAKTPKPIVYSVRGTKAGNSYEYIPESIIDRMCFCEAFEWFVAVIIDPLYVGHIVINRPSLYYRWPMSVKTENPREGWEEAAKLMHERGEGGPILPYVPTDFIENEWEW